MKYEHTKTITETITPSMIYDNKEAVEDALDLGYEIIDFRPPSAELCIDTDGKIYQNAIAKKPRLIIKKIDDTVQYAYDLRFSISSRDIYGENLERALNLIKNTGLIIKGFRPPMVGDDFIDSSGLGAVKARVISNFGPRLIVQPKANVSIQDWWE